MRLLGLEGSKDSHELYNPLESITFTLFLQLFWYYNSFNQRTQEIVESFVRDKREWSGMIENASSKAYLY